MEENYGKERSNTGWDSSLSYETFDEFLEEWHNADLDMNMIFRWDWERLNSAEYEKEFCELPDKESLNKCGVYSRLKLFYMMQRKGCKKFVSVEKMEDADHDKVVEFLLPRLEYIKKLWSPLEDYEPNN